MNWGRSGSFFSQHRPKRLVVVSRHIEDLNMLAYLNHSCQPNVVVDTTTLTISAARAIFLDEIARDAHVVYCNARVQSGQRVIGPTRWRPCLAGRGSARYLLPVCEIFCPSSGLAASFNVVLTMHRCVLGICPARRKPLLRCVDVGLISYPNTTVRQIFIMCHSVIP